MKTPDGILEELIEIARIPRLKRPENLFQRSKILWQELRTETKTSLVSMARMAEVYPPTVFRWAGGLSICRENPLQRIKRCLSTGNFPIEVKKWDVVTITQESGKDTFLVQIRLTQGQIVEMLSKNL